MNFDCLFDLFTNIGRKISLDTIRRKTLNKHQDFMRIFPDDFYDKTPRTKIIEELQRIDEFSPSMNDLSDTVLSSKLKQLQRTRHLALWHDGSTLSNHSHLLMMVNVLYDCLSSTHLKIINKKQVNSFKIALRQLNSWEHTRILLSAMAAPHLPFSLTNPPSYHLIPPKTQIP